MDVQDVRNEDGSMLARVWMRYLTSGEEADIRAALRGGFTMRGYNEAVLIDAVPVLLAEIERLRADLAATRAELSGWIYGPA